MTIQITKKQAALIALALVKLAQLMLEDECKYLASYIREMMVESEEE